MYFATQVLMLIAKRAPKSPKQANLQSTVMAYETKMPNVHHKERSLIPIVTNSISA